MKLILLINVSFLLFVGYSTTYRLADFPSKENYYKKFNDHAENKNISILLNTDSIITTTLGGKIWDDSLLYNVITVKNGNEGIPLNQINSIEYKTTDNRLAHISLENGREMETKDMIFLPSSIKCSISENLITHKSISLNSIKEISYKIRWPGIPIGFFAGSISGALAGYVGIEIFYDIRSRDSSQGFIAIGTALTGAMFGVIIGIINGFNYTYQFNH